VDNHHRALTPAALTSRRYRADAALDHRGVSVLTWLLGAAIVACPPRWSLSTSMAHTFVAPADASLIAAALDAMSRHLNPHGARQDPDDFGVPSVMRAGEIEADGWVAWRMLPSTLTEEDVRAVEREAGAEFPPLFRAFLTARFTMTIDVPWVRLPALPSDAPLRELLHTMRANAPLTAAGYLAFGWDTDDTGPVCFDIRRRLYDGDCPVVLFDHDLLIDAPTRESLEPIAQPFFCSFRRLVT
jgi:hypothetical protein